MDDLVEAIRRLGGAAKTLELVGTVATKQSLAAARRAGIVLRVRKGWYVAPTTPPDLAAAVRVGGRATCVTALRHHGVWVTARPELIHVAVHRSACELRAISNPRERQSKVSDGIVHWVDTARPRLVTGSRLLEAPVRALEDALGCLQGEDLLATVESALHLGVVTARQWREMRERMPTALRDELSSASALSGSGLETIFVFRCRRFGVRVRQQVQIGPDRVDVVLGDRLVVELDGRTYHDPGADRRRDARLVLPGARVLRFDYDLILEDWALVEAVVRASLARGDHL